MRTRRLVFSDVAISDILEQADWYEAQSGHRLGGRWERAVNSAILRALKRPGVGAPCSFRLASLRNVRRMTISGFPKHLLFYRFDEDESSYFALYTALVI